MLIGFASTAILGAGFSLPVVAKSVGDPSALPFATNSNPIFNVANLNHFSSDPSIIQVKDSYGNNVLAMISSHDLEKNVDPTISLSDNWPMNGTYLYGTFGSIVGDPTVTWFDHGPVLQEFNDPALQVPFFSWTKSGAKLMFAPDIQEFAADASNPQRQLWLYVPDVDTSSTRRIGMAHANITNGLFDGFAAEASPFTITGAPNNGYAFDPGVFLDDAPGQNKTYMVYANNFLGPRNLGMVAINADRKSGTYLGNIGFTGALKGYSGLNTYMEGPDIFKLTTPSGNAHYYMVFAANVENHDQNNDTGYIGYAMCSPAEFAPTLTSPSNPASCWKFKGWIFGNQFTGRSNHPSLIQLHDPNPYLADHYYIFFHRVMPGFDQTTSSRSRQICAKEFEIRDNPGAADDGEIIGVTRPTDANKEVRTMYGTLDDKSRSIAKGFIDTEDDDIGSSADSVITVSSFRNITKNTLYSPNFQLYYYVNVEPGQNLHADAINSAANYPFKLSLPSIKHVSLNTWAVALDYVGGSMSPATDLPGVNAQFALHYDTPSVLCSTLSYIINTLVPGYCWTFDKSNDFSQPAGNYPTFTTRVAMVNSNNNQLLAGEMPDMYDTYTSIRSVHKDKNNQYTYLTPSTANQDDAVNNQYLKYGWDQQQWIVEPVTNFNGLNAVIPVADRPNAVRLKNKWNSFYLTCNDVKQIGTDGQPYFFLLQQELRWNWETQIWIKDDAGNGAVRYRSAWVKDSSAPLFLAINYGNFKFPLYNYVDAGLQFAYAQPLRPNSDRQLWISESVSYKVLRAEHIDKNNQLTYLTAATTNVDQGINNQYVQTGSDLQKWIIEPVTDFTGLSVAQGDQPYAVRFRNKQTGFYATSNNVQQTSSDGQPYFWLFDQALRTNWMSQVWIKELLEDGSYQLRNAWKPSSTSPALYLTLNPNTKNNGDKGTQDVYLRALGYTTGGIPFWQTQYWIIE